MQAQTIVFISTGGTIDKIYFDAKSTYAVGDPQVIDILDEANATFNYRIIPLLRKDSLELTESDRALVRQVIANDPGERFIVTHGTDTMVETGQALQGLENKVIVLTGSLKPARFKYSDAEFNIGVAIGAVQTLPPGVYLAMNGQIFNPAQARKNRDHNRFETVSPETQT